MKILTLRIAAVMTLAFSFTTAALAATDEEKCEKKKLLALGKRELCLQKERAKEVLGKTPNVAGCAEKFDKGIAAAEKKATCRWLENGDGTATDLNSGLQWELKTDDGSIHDKDDTYVWGGLLGGGLFKPDGTAFVDFLGTLNGGKMMPSAVTTTGCFAEKCDWRLPKIEELLGLLSHRAPWIDAPCETSPCTTIPGETVLSFYWSSSTIGDDSSSVWVANFDHGGLTDRGKWADLHVRAVRGGS